MGEINRDAITVGLLVGIVSLVILFAGQTLSYTVRWLSRAISGGIIVLLAIGLGYAAYELYSGWTAAEDGTLSKLEQFQQESGPNVEHNGNQTDRDDSISEQEIDDELEALIEDTNGATNNPTREAE